MVGSSPLCGKEGRKERRRQREEGKETDVYTGVLEPAEEAREKGERTKGQGWGEWRLAEVSLLLFDCSEPVGNLLQ